MTSKNRRGRVKEGAAGEGIKVETGVRFIVYRKLCLLMRPCCPGE